MTKAASDMIQMSAYIDIEEYEREELKHPHYTESMDRLIGFIGGLITNESKVLEVCAGTGFFTERLAKAHPNVEITASEIDVNCLELLKKKMQKFKNVNVLHTDAVTHHFGQQYDIIVSSLSYHHINLLERMRYWINMRSALKPGGHYIMSEELIPDFSTEDERKKVTRHAKNYFIEQCEKDGHKRTAELQKLFLYASLGGVEEYKISDKMLEHELRNSGFDILTKHKIGPLDRNDVGGIYAYLTKKKALS